MTGKIRDLKFYFQGKSYSKILKSLIPSLAVCFSISTQASVGEIFTFDALTYRVLTESGSSGTVCVCDYADTPVALEIPAVVANSERKYSVTGIAENALSYYQTLESVVIGANVTAIEANAFLGCYNLQTLMIGKNVEAIGDSAFSGCSSLESVTIPDKVTVLGNNVFAFCDSLKTVTLGRSVQTIGEGAFACSGLETITADTKNTAYYTLDGVLLSKDCQTLIQYPAGNTRTVYTLLYTVTVIEKGAFADSACLEEVILPAALTTIKDKAFYGCDNLKSITVDAGNNYYLSKEGVLFDKKQERLIQYPSGIERSSYTIPDSVTEIARGAFSKCFYLENIVLGRGLTSLESGIFDGCRNLKTITIPAGIRDISTDAFEGCSRLENIVVDPANPVYSSEEGVLFDKGQTVLIQYPAGNKRNSYELPSMVRSIRGNAFAGCIWLTDITLDDSLETIADDAFYGCGALEAFHVSPANPNYSTLDGVLLDKARTTLLQYPVGNTRSGYTLPDSVISIGANAFRGSFDLENVIFGQNVKSIGSAAFRECVNLRNIVFNNGLESIGAEAFQSCENLKTITIPANVSTIGNYAFAWCKRLTSVYYTGNVPQADSSMYSNTPSTLVSYYSPAYAASWQTVIDMYHSWQGRLTECGDAPARIAELSYVYADGILTLTFTGILQESVDARSWTDVPNARNTLKVNVSKEDLRFYRAVN